LQKELTELGQDEDAESHDEDTAAVRIVNAKNLLQVLKHCSHCKS
jgi:hypothetical protein